MLFGYTESKDMSGWAQRFEQKSRAWVVLLASVFVDIFPDDVCAPAETANASAMALASTQGAKVFISNSLSHVDDARFE